MRVALVYERQRPPRSGPRLTEWRSGTASSGRHGSASAPPEMGRDYRLGYGLTVLQRGAMSFDLGIDCRPAPKPGAMWAPSTAFKAGSRRAGEYSTVWGHSFGESPDSPRMEADPS